eukprot:300443-Amphidinium_carterae.1
MAFCTMWTLEAEAIGTVTVSRMMGTRGLPRLEQHSCSTRTSLIREQDKQLCCHSGLFALLIRPFTLAVSIIQAKEYRSGLEHPSPSKPRESRREPRPHGVQLPTKGCVKLFQAL